jgi:hypothetical protein
MPLFLIMRKKPLAWRQYASWVATVRDAFRQQALGEAPTRAERRRQDQLPVDVRRVIRRYKREQSRYRSVRRDQPQKCPRVVRAEQPKHVWGFQDAMVTIAAIAGVSMATLYRWDKKFRDERSQWDQKDSAERKLPRQAAWRPKSTRARRKRGDAYELPPPATVADQLEPEPTAKPYEVSAAVVRLLRIPPESRTDRVKRTIAHHLERVLTSRGAGTLNVHTVDEHGNQRSPEAILMWKYNHLMENWQMLWERFPPVPEL